jgi:CBS domain-containing protein
MEAKDVMTPNPVCCGPDTSLREVAQLMTEHDCGAIPVVDGATTRSPIGIITDRDIACRSVAVGTNPLELSAGDCMSAPCIAVSVETSLEDCCNAMETSKVRRLLVLDKSGACIGIISQADVALRGQDEKATELLKEVSQPTTSASAVPI